MLLSEATGDSRLGEPLLARLPEGAVEISLSKDMRQHRADQPRRSRVVWYHCDEYCSSVHAGSCVDFAIGPVDGEAGLGRGSGNPLSTTRKSKTSESRESESKALDGMVGNGDGVRIHSGPWVWAPYLARPLPTRPHQGRQSARSGVQGSCPVISTISHAARSSKRDDSVNPDPSPPRRIGERRVPGTRPAWWSVGSAQNGE